MLQNIRDKSTGLVAWIIVILLIATFALWGIHNYVSSSKNSDIVATVNHHDITQHELNAAYQRMRQQQQLQLGANFSLSQSAESQLKQQALNQLILSNVLIDAASKAGYRVTLPQVNEALLQIPAFQENGQFSVRRFQDILNGMLYSQSQFLDDMRNSMLINQVQGGYVNSAYALPDEINTAVKLINQKRDISYLIVPTARFNKNIKIPADEVKQYYQSHQNEFQSPEQVSVSYLELSLNDIKNKLHFDNTKLQQYYENNLQNYTKPAQWHVATILLKDDQQQAQAIYQQLKAGADFTKLAEKYSQDTASAKKSGELAWFSAGTLDPTFEKAVASLQKVGEVSAPIKTGYGFSIIKLLGEKKPEVLPFNHVKVQVQNALSQQQAEQVFSDQSDKLSNLSYSNPDSLDMAAKALNLTIQTTNLFSRQGEKSGILSNPRVLNAAFSNDVLQQGNNSDLLQLDPNTVVVLRVKEHKPASILPLADVQNTIQTQLRSKMAQQEAQKFGEELMSRLKNQHVSFGQLAKLYSLSLQEDKNASRYDPKIDAAILNQTFKTNALKGFALPSGDYVIINVNAIHDGVLNKDDEIQTRIFQEEIEKNYGNIDYQLYVQALMKKAKIKVNQNFSTESNTLDDLSSS